MGFFKAVKNRALRSIYQMVSRAIKTTSPVTNFSDKSNLVVLSMVRSADVNMLLVSLKSFTQYVTVNHFVIVTDDDVTEKDQALLKAHLVNVVFMPVSEQRHPGLPKGGCWERLAALALVCQKYYVIQLDADAITYENPRLVKTCARSGVAFTLGTSSGQKVVSLNEAALFAEEQIKASNNHIQILCESLLTDIKGRYTQYVSGCAGFTGFPKGAISLRDLLDISQRYERLGESWGRWGTEQFASNLLLANLKKVNVLPLVDYDTAPNGRVLGHYIGTMRFSDFTYIVDTCNFILSLRKTQQSVRYD